MRLSSKRILIAGLLSAALAGCASVQVTTPDAPQETAAPAHWRLDEARPPADNDGYRPPRRLAVLLPMTGPLATAAAPVRDGLLAGYYGERRERPELTFHDTAGTVAGASAAYARAVADGADQILGPLGRDEVTALFQAASPDGPPMIALNQGGGPPPFNATSFSLAPEDEGTAAADYLIARNAQRVLVLSNGDDNAQRSLAAFRERLQGAGAAIVGELAVGDRPELTAAMQAAASGEHGADAVLLAVRGNQAHLLAPQMFSAGLATRLRVATSQIATGTGRPEEDRALDGILFPSEHWTVGNRTPLPVAGDLPTARGPAGRLFAFGHDAWLLSAYLPRLAARPGAQIEGATGTLGMDANGQLLRTPVWATWRNGGIVAADAR